MNLRETFSFLTIFSLIIFVRLIVSTSRSNKSSFDSFRKENDSINEKSSDENEENRDRLKSLKSFQTNFFFIDRIKSTELIAGELTRILIGTRNMANEDLFVESIEGSIRYPFDFSYFIQNLTSLRLFKVLPMSYESTFEYLFVPSETFAGRSMGFVLLIHLRDQNGNQYENILFNQTINFLNMEHQFDRETFSLYLFFIGFIFLIGFLLYQYLFNSHWKRKNQRKSIFNSFKEQNKENYDFDWIPKHHLISTKIELKRTKNENKIRSIHRLTLINEGEKMLVDNDMIIH